ncbi:hypothetical protein FRC00_010837 [Tulasnella sp. 408]|nr:hypothetical protein FRC00_010837 [Tulasnella sp. 408]
MRFTSALALLSAPLLALSHVVIRTYYSSGALYLAIDTYTGAPSSVDIVAIDSSGNQYDLATGVSTTGSGNLRIFLPASTRPGSYHVLAVNPATGETLSTSESFYVCESDLAAASSLSLQSVSFTHAVTGSIIPYVSTSYPANYSDIYWSIRTHYYTHSGPTPTSSAESHVCSVSTRSISLYSPLTVPTNSVVTGSSGTSTVPVTQTNIGSSGASTVPVTQTSAGSVSSSSGAATAALLAAPTTTTRSGGFKNTVGGGVFAPVAAVAVGAAMFF